MVKEYSIKVNNISKTFKRPQEKKMRLKDYFLSPFSRTTFDNFHALKDISFNIEPGDFVGIIGRNGSGKSTLLKMLAQVYEPDKGSIEVNGKLVPFLELGVGFNPELTGKENVFLNGTILGMTNKEIKEKYNSIVEFAEISDFMETQLKHYSSGMMVRLAFAIAIQAQGDIYLLDEVLAVGDAGFQTKSQQEILKLKKSGKTIVFVSHDHSSIQKFADKVIWINQSKIKGVADSQVGIINLISDYLKTFSVSNSSITGDEEKNNILDLNVTILDQNLKASKIFGKGDFMNIQIKYDLHLKSVLKDLNIGIGINNNIGVNIFGANTLDHKVKLEKVQGIINFEIPHLGLLAGEYNIILGAEYIPGKSCYSSNKFYPITVLSNEKITGIVPLPIRILVK